MVESQQQKWWRSPIKGDIVTRPDTNNVWTLIFHLNTHPQHQYRKLHVEPLPLAALWSFRLCSATGESGWDTAELPGNVCVRLCGFFLSACWAALHCYRVFWPHSCLWDVAFSHWSACFQSKSDVIPPVYCRMKELKSGLFFFFF